MAPTMASVELLSGFGASSDGIVLPTTAAPVNFLEDSTIVLLVSVLLRAAIFIRSDGEVRLTPDCRSADESDHSKQMLKHCQTVTGVDGQQKSRCLFASNSGQHLLAMDRSSGQLIAVPVSAHHIWRPANAPAFACPWFEVSDAKVQGHAVFITGCPDDERYPLRFFGQRLRQNTSCQAVAANSYSQIPRHSRLYHVPRQGQFKIVDSYSAEITTVCSEHGIRRIGSRCASVLRASYPLSWLSCAHDAAEQLPAHASQYKERGIQQQPALQPYNEEKEEASPTPGEDMSLPN